MAIHIDEVFPLLAQISTQQRTRSERLQKLIDTFKRAPEPVEPTLRSMLKPLRKRMDDMKDVLHRGRNPSN
ncbi:hypothetical protein AAKU55_005652 [Oxalobacteraceae bacterium GrIS 1.11]